MYMSVYVLYPYVHKKKYLKLHVGGLLCFWPGPANWPSKFFDAA